jgi:tetratricopeptide (TPR) repeat protein
MSLRFRQRSWAVGIIAVLVVSFATATPPVRGEGNGPAIGSKVAIKPEAVLKVGDRVTDTGKSHRLYTVAQAKGEWLWLTSGATGGWARTADVLPLDRAIEFYSAAIKSDPNAAWAYFNRGRIWHDRWDFDRAIADYSEAIRLDPNSAAALANRGVARQAKGDLNKAIADYGEAIRLGLRTAQVYNNRGHAWELRGDYDNAIADDTEAIRLRPGYLFSWLNRGNVWKAKGDFGKALADYEAATRIDATSPWAYALQADLLATHPMNERDGRRAVELSSKATELGGTGDAYLCEVRALAHAAVGEFERAAEWRTKAREAASKAPGGAPIARRGQLRRPYERTPLGTFPISDMLDILRSASSGGAEAGIRNTGGSSRSAGGQPISYYGANYVLLPNGDTPTVLPQAGGSNINYITSAPTYFPGNSPIAGYGSGVASGHPAGRGPVNPVDPTYFGANYSGKTLITPDYSSSPISRSYYGANYSGTAVFNPSNPAGAAPFNPGLGTSYYGADYSGTMSFTPGSIGTPSAPTQIGVPAIPR